MKPQYFYTIRQQTGKQNVTGHERRTVDPSANERYLYNSNPDSRGELTLSTIMYTAIAVALRRNLL